MSALSAQIARNVLIGMFAAGVGRPLAADAMNTARLAGKRMRIPAGIANQPPHLLAISRMKTHRNP
jgi:hypothetical protein